MSTRYDMTCLFLFHSLYFYPMFSHWFMLWYPLPVRRDMSWYVWFWQSYFDYLSTISLWAMTMITIQWTFFSLQLYINPDHMIDSLISTPFLFPVAWHDVSIWFWAFYYLQFLSSSSFLFLKATIQWTFFLGQLHYQPWSTLIILWMVGTWIGSLDVRNNVRRPPCYLFWCDMTWHVHFDSDRLTISFWAWLRWSVPSIDLYHLHIILILAVVI